MIDETAANWTFAEEPDESPVHDAADESAVDDPWARQLDPGLLMGFLSEFRSATREKAAEERAAAVARKREPVTSRFAAGPEPEPWEGDPYAGSDAQVTPEWWYATDGRWYPPELHPDRQVPVEPAQGICEAVAETVPSVESVPGVEPVPPVESAGTDRPVRKSFLGRSRREAGGLALEM